MLLVLSCLIEKDDFTVILSISSAYASISLLDEYKVYTRLTRPINGINGKTSSQRNILIIEGKCQCQNQIK